MRRPIRSSFSKVRIYIVRCYLPAHLAVCDKLVSLFGCMYGTGEYYISLCNLLQLQRVLVESMAGFAGDINFKESITENLN